MYRGYLHLLRGVRQCNLYRKGAPGVYTQVELHKLESPSSLGWIIRVLPSVITPAVPHQLD